MFGAAVIERTTLIANHVLRSEPVAVERLRPHAQRFIELHLEGWPSLLPALPRTVFKITPAGLIEWVPDAPPEEAALRVRIDASNPAMLVAGAVAGERPRIDISGDAAFATDLDWLIDNVRWDIEDDLARVIGPMPARTIARIGGFFAEGLRQLVKRVSRITPDATSPQKP